MESIELSSTLRARLCAPGPIVAITGAGVSAESGLSTFRGTGGHWEGRDPASLATPEAFEADPLTVWRFYAWRRERAAAARPNAAHHALSRIESRRDDFCLVTQNVDGLHERAGSRRVMRLHGTLWRLRCLAENVEREDLRADLGPLPARCACGGLLRPGVVWFGEPLPAAVLRAAAEAAAAARVVIVAGTSSVVYPAAWLPRLARDAGAYVVEVNPEATPLSPLAHERLEGPAARWLPLLADAAAPERVA